MQETTSILTPIMQFGFAGLSAVLLVILVWLIKELLSILKETNRIIAANTQAIQSVDENARIVVNTTNALKDEIYKRPCIARIHVD